MSMPPLKGYIALLDVLGFSELIARESRAPELERYFDAIDQATNKIGDVQYVLFSDTIVISTSSDTPEDLLQIVKASSYAMHYLLKEGLPVRGAISHGTYYRSRPEKGVVIAGPAFIEAYHFEKGQNWVGITLAPSVLRQVPDLPSRCQLPSEVPRDNVWEFEDRVIWAMALQLCESIPWHGEFPNSLGTLSGFAIVPLSPGWNFRQMPQGLRTVLDYLRKQQLLAGNPNAQAKYKEPIHWLAVLANGWRDRVGISTS